MADEEIDVEALREELDQIKSAMGIGERYPGQLQLWLVYGLLVVLASVGSQVVVLQELPGYYHAVVWGVFMSVGGVYAWRTGEDRSHTGEAKPSVPLQFASVFAFYVVLVVVLGQLSIDPQLETAVVFGLIVALVGVAYLVVGNTLRAYYIRKRDRMALYVGGLWMLAFGALVPVVEPLREWGYVVFGVLYGVHSLAAYLYLSE